MPIDFPNTILTSEEVEQFLREDGYVKDTKEYLAERCRRYYPTHGGWAEKDSWKGDRRKAS